MAIALTRSIDWTCNHTATDKYCQTNIHQLQSIFTVATEIGLLTGDLTFATFFFNHCAMGNISKNSDEVDEP